MPKSILLFMAKRSQRRHIYIDTLKRYIISDSIRTKIKDTRTPNYPPTTSNG
jgi:hypothetical protein